MLIWNMSTELKVQNKFINSLLPSTSPTKNTMPWKLQKYHELFQEWMINIQTYVQNFAQEHANILPF